MNIPTLRLVFDRKGVATTSNAPHRRQGLVQIEITHERKRKYISTGVKVYRDQWLSDREPHIIGTTYATMFNETISVALDKARKSINEFIRDGSDGMPQMNERISLGEYGRKYLASLRGKSDGSMRTWSAYVDKIDAFDGFADIATITKTNLLDFDNFLVDDGLSGTTRNLVLSFVKRLLLDAYERGRIVSNPSAGLRLPRKSVATRLYLTEEQIAQLEKADVGDNRKYLDCFLFQCYTGLSYSDIKTLTPDMVVMDGGKSFIVRNRQKTKTHYRVMMITQADAIWRKYNGLLPVPKYASHYDNRLEKISKDVGIGVRLSSHIGRHTFATLALSKGVPIEIVSKMLGHTNIQTTQIYAKVLAKDVDEQFMRLDKLINKKG